MIGVLDHQMYIEREPCRFPYVPNNVWPERNIIDEMSVHDVAMNPIGACGFDLVDLIAKPREVSGKNGWGNDHFSHGATE
jgi:hypothetical protein